MRIKEVLGYQLACSGCECEVSKGSQRRYCMHIEIIGESFKRVQEAIDFDLF